MIAGVMGVTGWSIVFAAFVLWEAGGIVFHYPRLEHMIGYVTRWRLGRYVVFGMWLWVGWHLFIRGWHFFMRGYVS